MALSPFYAIPYTEFRGSPKEHFEDDNSSAQRVVQCAWIDRGKLKTEILGFPTYMQGSQGAHQPGWIARTLPWYHPDYAGNINGSLTSTYLWAKSVDIEPLGKPTFIAPGYAGGLLGVNNYNSAVPGARLTITHTTRTYDLISDALMVAISATVASVGGSVPDEASLFRYVTRRMVPAGEFIQIPAGSFYYVAPNAGDYVTYGTNKLIIHATHTITWHQIPIQALPCSQINPQYPPILAGQGPIETCIGKVNKSVFMNCPVGTLLLLSAELKPFVSHLGARLFDIVYSFKHFSPGPDANDNTKQATHQHVWKPQTPGNKNLSVGWTEVTTTAKTQTYPTASNLVTQANSVNIYDYADFATLFRPPF